MDSDVPFWIEAESASTKRQRNRTFNNLSTLCKNNYGARLNIDFIVHSKEDAEGTSIDWDEMVHSDKVFVENLDKDIATDDLVYVLADEDEKPNKPEDGKGNDNAEAQPFDDCWVAHVLEIRSLGDAESVTGFVTESNFVYVRVNWLYRPGDLDANLRGKHLASGEVVPSNYMQIIDARTIAGKVEHLKHIDENDFASLSGGYEELAWRQTFDYFKQSQRISKVRNICVCEEPANLDFGPLMCNAIGGCSFLMHPDCIADHIICRMYREHVLHERLDGPTPGKQTPPRPPSSMVQTARKYFDLDLTSSADGNKTGPFMAKVLRLRETKHGGRDELKKEFDQPVHCLRCFKMLGQQIGHALLDPDEGVRS